MHAIHNTRRAVKHDCLRLHHTYLEEQEFVKLEEEQEFVKLEEEQIIKCTVISHTSLASILQNHEH